jgi:hypothetical protein
MPNVRGSKVRTFADSDDLWPAAEEYAREHGLATASDVVRLALRRLLRPGEGGGGSFTARGERLTAPPESLLRALRDLGDDEAADRLVATYRPRTERADRRR